MNRPTNGFHKWVFTAVTAIVLVGMPLAAITAPPEVQDEYARRLAKLTPDDVSGHYDLAVWCREKGAWLLVRKECETVLAQAPKHEPARLLMELAQRKLGEVQRPPAQPGSATGGGQTFDPLPAVISDEDVQTIRWMEMLDQEPRPLAIQLNNQVVQRFLEAMAGTEGFTTREERRDFMRLNPTEKLHEIRKHTNERYRSDVVIKSDPKRMADFDRNVLPIVVRNCATASCHGNPRNSRFALYTDQVKNTNKTYTNYLIMHKCQSGGKRLINRDDPERSLLLTYGLRELPPSTDSTYRHHHADIRPMFRDANDRTYRDILEWLRSLSTLEPEYGIKLEPPTINP